MVTKKIPIIKHDANAKPGMPSPDEIARRKNEVFIQRFDNFVLGATFHALQGGVGVKDGSVDGEPDFKPTLHAAIEAGKVYMKEMWGINITSEEIPEGTQDKDNE